MYIYNSTFPTRSRWWQRDMSTKTNITITTPDARPTTWYIGIYGFEACSFQLTANVFRTLFSPDLTSICIRTPPNSHLCV